jgi:hypothetical protein
MDLLSVDWAACLDSVGASLAPITRPLPRNDFAPPLPSRSAAPKFQELARMNVGRDIRLRNMHRRNKQSPGSRLPPRRFIVAETDGGGALRRPCGTGRWTLAGFSGVLDVPRLKMHWWIGLESGTGYSPGAVMGASFLIVAQQSNRVHDRAVRLRFDMENHYAWNRRRTRTFCRWSYRLPPQVWSRSWISSQESVLVNCSSPPRVSSISVRLRSCSRSIFSSTVPRVISL